jgi:hypothetical protein
MSTVETSVVPWKDEMEKGWPTLLTSLICVGLGAASLLFYSIGVFFGPFQNEFCWNRGQISGAFIYLTLGFVISGPILGWLIDRYGARVVALASIPLLSLSMIGLANMGNSLAGFYGLFFLRGLFWRRHRADRLHASRQWPVCRGARDGPWHHSRRDWYRGVCPPAIPSRNYRIVRLA